MIERQRRIVYPAARAVLLLVLGFSCATVARPALGQTSTPPEQEGGSTQWRLHLSGERVDWPLSTASAPLDSLDSVGRRVLSHLREAGYYYARLDSATVDSGTQPAVVHLYGRRGPRVRIGELRVPGVDLLSTEAVLGLMETEVGSVLRPATLEADIDTILSAYEKLGRPLAEARVQKTTITTDSGRALRLTLRVGEGPEMWLKEIEVPEDARTSPGLLAQLGKLDIGQSLRAFEADVFRSRLQEYDIFEQVGAPELQVEADGGATLHVPLEEASPGAFDFVLGYLPPSQTRESGQLVGSGHLLLKHLFGGGRTADLTLDRRPGRTSIVDVAISDPYLLGLPLRLEGAFRGEQRDSTYGERTYSVQAGYGLGNGLEVTASLSREVVRPGPAGRTFREGRQEIPRSSTFFYGAGLQYRTVDRFRNPRRGVHVDVEYSQGRKTRRLGRISPRGDTTRVSDSFRQERMRGRLRAYIPLFQRQVVAVGGEGAVLFSPANIPDRSDLFRLGGSTSLRGYNEDQFLGDVVGRALLEYRLQLDLESYAFAFVDLGYVSRPRLNSTREGHGWHPGYGVGVQLQTAIGRISTTYALNPDVETPANGRIHLGLSVGL